MSDETPRDQARWPYRMRDLCERTGLPRQAIHFYLQQGLLPAPHKAGRNMAYYGDEHLERLQLIRRLQQERFLPLKAIRALLEGRDDVFSAEQQKTLRGVRAMLPAPLWQRATDRLDAQAELQRLGLPDDELRGLIEAGLLATQTDEAGRECIARDDLWLLELRAAMQAQGFTRELGFTSRDIAIYDEAVTAMLARETQLMATRLAHLPPERIAEMLERGLPVVHELITRLHLSRVRDFIDAL